MISGQGHISRRRTTRSLSRPRTRSTAVAPHRVLYRQATTVRLVPKNEASSTLLYRSEPLMEPVGRGCRFYFAAVGLLALWVGFWGSFVPSRVDVALPFLVPPLHARFLGAMYLSGLTLQIAGLTARRWAAIRVVPLITAIWTGGLFVVSLLHLEVFDFGAGVAIWFAAYLSYPLIALWLLWSHRAAANERLPGAPLPAWARTYLTLQGVVTTGVALALFTIPDTMIDAWPWPITRLLAQLYFAPLLAYGIGSIVLAREHTWPEIRVGVTAMFTFAVGVLVASLLHRDLFSRDELSDVIWFTAFAIVSAALAVLGARSISGVSRTVSP
jgi:hypothetical protein